MEKIPTTVFETKENNERPARFKTIERKVIEVLPTGESVEEVLECNGIHHRRCVDKISYFADGEINFAGQLSKVDLGPCTCNRA